MITLILAVLSLLGMQDITREMEVVYEYLLSPEQRAEFDELRSNAARNEYLDDYWSALNPGANPGFNELREELNRRLDMVTSIYESQVMNIEGWRTDRGRALILLGYPDQIRRSSFGPTGDVKYEIWVYSDSPDDPNPVEIVFEDISDSGEFELRTEVIFPNRIYLESRKPELAGQEE